MCDAAGHLVENHSHEYTLPFGFKSVALSQSTATSQLSTNTNTTIADNTQDTLNLAAANKWIRTAGNNSTNTIQIAHETHDIDTNPATGTDLNNSANSTFTVQDLIFDEAGHVTSNKTHQYTLPYNFKTVAIGAATTAVTDGSTNTTNVNLVADSHVDTLTINPGNRWIALQGQDGSDTLTIAHAFAGSDAGRVYGDATAQTPQFGATFKVPYFGVDAAGHVNTQSEHTVTIPKPSLTPGTGNVMVGLSLTPETGAFVATNANVGTLPITGFTPSITAAELQVDDSINTAFGKLQSRIAAEEKRVDDLDVVDNAIEKQYVTSVSQTDGKITVSRGSLTEALDDTYAPLEDNVDKDTTFIYISGADNGADKTLEWLFKKVADLEKTVNTHLNNLPPVDANVFIFSIGDSRSRWGVYAEENMTWEDWINSEYSDDNYTIADDGAVCYIGNPISNPEDVYSYVLPTDIIQPGWNYNLDAA